MSQSDFKELQNATLVLLCKVAVLVFKVNKKCPSTQTHTLSLFPSELNRKRNYSGQKQDESSKLNSKITNSILRLPSAGKG